MNTAKKLLLLFQNKSYFTKVKGLFGSALIAFWKLDEKSGSTAADSSGNARSGSYTNCVLGQPTIGGKTLSTYFLETSNPYVNVYSSSLASAFNGAEGTIQLLVKAGNAGFWTDAGSFRQVTFGADANNRVLIQRTNGNPNALDLYYIAGGTSKTRTISTSTLSTMCLTITWSKSNDRVRAYWNGVQQGADLTGLGTWAGALASSTCVIGAATTTPAIPHRGWISNVFVLNREATPTEVLASLPPLA